MFKPKVVVPSNYWKDPLHQKIFFDEIGKKLNLESPTDWKKVTRSQLKQFGADGLISRYYKGSIYKALESIYPSVDWNFWEFENTPRNLWKNATHQRKYFDWLGRSLGLNTLDDWYQITYQHLVQKGHGYVVNRYFGKSLWKALSSAYPENDWRAWKFQSKLPRKYWNEPAHQRKFMEEIASQIGVKTFDDWYSVKPSTLNSYGGRFLLSLYGNNLSLLLKNVFPEYPWKFYRFRKVPKGYWEKEEHVREYLSWLGEQYGITQLNDWYSLGFDQLQRISRRYQGVMPLLAKCFPQHKWDESLLSGPKQGKSQRFLANKIKEIFPGHEVLINHKHPKLLYGNTNREMELDIFLPSLQLAFEYQGQQHYGWHSLYGSPEVLQKHDVEKKVGCENNGITLLDIPFWWNRSTGELVATILKHRPDIATLFPPIRNLLQDHKPIAQVMPPNKQRHKRPSKKGFNTPLAQPQKWNSEFEYKGWCISEIEDGVRVLYDGRGHLYTTFGELLSPPEGYLDNLPNVSLEGILSCGKGNGKMTEQIVYSTSASKWPGVTLVLHDAPSQTHLKYRDRLLYLKNMLKEISQPDKTMADSVECLGKEHLQQQLEKNIKGGGMGLYLRDPDSLYLHPNSFYRMAPFEREQVGVMSKSDGILTCKRPNGVQFTVKYLSNEPIAAGSVVTVQYNSLDSQGAPTDATFIRINLGRKWEENDTTSSPFHVTVGSPVGGFPKCRGCYKMLTDRSQLRFEVRATYTPPSDIPSVVTLRACLSKECLQKAYDRYSTKRGTGVYFPEFTNEAVIHKNLQQEKKDELAKMSDMHWIVTE